MLNSRISVIIPLYNTEKYIKRCIDSITSQTYPNLEIIVVNDKSTDNGPDIVSQLMAADDRIRMLHHEQNKGLYHARITGVENASGDYIAFVDSDDYVSSDFFRVLLQKSEDGLCDIVVGKATHEDENGYRYVHNMYDSMDFGTVEGSDITSAYWEQCGHNFIWHTVWNKLYKRSLWNKVLPILKKQDKHLIMTEDFVFSSVLMNYAQRLSSVEYGCYFYFQRSDASTSLNGNAAKFEKNITDICTAFDFVENHINSGDYRVDVRREFADWKALYKFFWTRNISSSSLEEAQQNELAKLLEKGMPDTEAAAKFPDYFYHVTTDYDNRYNELSEAIASDKTDCVSFDIFDTALVRPFYDPHDLFATLDKDYTALAPNDSRSFSWIRDNAEAQIRKKLIYCDRPFGEEIKLDDIYAEMISFFDVKQTAADKMKIFEREAELRFCRRRKSVYNLYRLALFCGKKIFFTTDIYLDREFISRLLEKNGYTEYDGLLISCEENKTKRTGSLFEVLISKSGCEASRILHIGDNLESDVVMPDKYSIRTQFYAKCTDCILHNIPDIKTTHSADAYKGSYGDMINYQKALGFLGNRTAFTLAAIKLYDNPFISYNEWSEMNCSPQFFGYYALGMHLLGFTKWFTEQAIEKGYDTLSFISRDGWLPMKAYELLKSFYQNAPSAAYICTSRKAAIPCGIKDESDLYSLYDCINPDTCTPDVLAQMLSPVLEEYDPQFYRENGIATDEPIGSRDSFSAFIKLLAKNSFSRQKSDEFTTLMKRYFEPLLQGKSAVVDIGYSGRTQEMITKTTGKSVDAFYVHTHNQKCNIREARYGFKIHSFYGFTPSITGASRELMFSQYSPSCVGYDCDDESANPVFEPFEEIYPLKYLITEMQSSALELVQDFCRDFGECLDIMAMRNEEISYPFEYFLHTLTDADAWMFECVEFEDDMWAGRVIKLSEAWRADIAYHKTMNRRELSDTVRAEYMHIPYEQLIYELFKQSGVSERNIFRKALFWLGTDTKFFYSKIKKRIKRK